VAFRLIAFYGVFLIMALLEFGFKRRVLSVSKLRRWKINIGMTYSNTIIVALIFNLLLGFSSLGFATWVNTSNYGLLSMLGMPSYVNIVVAVIFLDFVIYWQHVVAHRIPLIWKLHQVHHCDLDYDVTTALRFHPIEIIFSMLVKFTAIILIGAPMVAVLIFEIVLNACAMFNHANVSLPLGLDRILRLVFVTPDVHRIHHSTVRDECDSNYGFNLVLWDHLFGSYKAQPEAGHLDMIIGLPEKQDEKELGFFSLLKMPFG
jgi:sterol desaturase/sphingolipid hydroxylase (fatty acid hydroxylase superfamily)